MNPAFSAWLDILPPPQRRLWDELSGLPPAFVLYGGTAVALDAILAEGQIDLPMALSAGRLLHGEAFNPLPTLKALTYFEDGNVSRLPASMKRRLVAATRAVDLDRLPLIGTHDARPGQ